MKKKFMRGVAAFLAVVMMMPVSAFATTGGTEDPAGGGEPPIATVSEVPTFEISISDELYNTGTNTEATLNLTATGATITNKVWTLLSGDDIISLNSSSGKVTAKKAGTATVSVAYTYTVGEDTTVQSGAKTETITVNEYKIQSASLDSSTKTQYVAGQTIKKSDIKVNVVYTDGTTGTTTDFAYTPTEALDPTKHDTLQVTVAGLTDPLTADLTIIAVDQEDLVKEISITSPTASDTFTVGDKLKLSQIVVRIDYVDGTYALTSPAANTDISVSGMDFGSSGVYTFSTDDISKKPTLNVEYAGDSDSVTLTVKAKEVKPETPAETKPTITNPTSNGYILPTTGPSKTTYKVGDNVFETAGMSLYLTYTDTSKNYWYAFPSTYTITAFKNAGTNVSLTLSGFADKYGNAFSIKITGLTVTAGVAITGLDADSKDYELKDDVEVTLNDELDWEDFFKEIVVNYTEGGSNKSQIIEDDEDLAHYFPGAKLHLVVVGKEGKDDADIVEAKDVSNGQVYLRLYIEDSAGTAITSNSKSIRVYLDVVDAEVTVSIYSSTSSTSSSYLKGAAIFDSLKSAFQAIEDEDSDEFEEAFGEDVSLGSKYAIRIKLGENQSISDTYTFEPNSAVPVYIDLNGYKLTISAAKWISYDDEEDFTLTITNSYEYDEDDDDEDDDADRTATLVYRDMDVTLTVDKNDTLVFSEDTIPGVYKVEIKDDITNGKVTANKTSIGHGETVKFTITPDENYEISSFKVGSKSITTSTEGYSVNTKTGVAVYEMKDVTGNLVVTATFKKTAAAEEAEKEETSAAANWKNPFTDVSNRAQYYEAVAFVCSEGLFNGMTATKFEPNTTMTRAMFVTVLGRLAKVDTSRYSGSSFTDVSIYDAQISWAVPYIEWGVEMGLLQGYGNGKFGPNDPITHQQMYLLMHRYAMYIENLNGSVTGVSLSSLRDASEIADWAEDGVKFASKNGLLITSGGKLTPTENALRCELAMLLHGFCQKVLKYN